MATKRDVHHPSNFLFFDTETQPTKKSKQTQQQIHKLWFGAYWTFRYVDKKQTRNNKGLFYSSDSFFQVIKQRLDKSRPLYIFAHNLGFDLTIVDFWEQAEEHGLECLYAILEDPPLFLSYRWEECKIIFVDTFNFWKCGVADMGKSLGYPKLDIDITTATDEEAIPYCERDVEIIAKQVIELLDFLTDNDLGSFGISAPTIAMNTFKKRFMKHEIFIHDRTRILALERQCYYGGLVNNFYVGKSQGQLIYHTDVNSLYPSVMLGLFPTKLVSSQLDVKPPISLLANDRIGYCADVTIQCQGRSYPKRYHNRLCEVTGKFRTQLCGAEFAQAIRCNSVLHIHQLATYEMEPIFKEYVEYFWKLRQKHSIPKGNPREQLIKLLMNSLYGKFGMKGFDWKDFTSDNLEAYYALMGVDYPKQYRSPNFIPTVENYTSLWHALEMDQPIKIRHLNGKTQIQFPTGEHTESFCAIAAFVTAYARERLRQLIGIAGYHHTYYCDTDSLFVDQYGYSQLVKAGEVESKTLGKLKLEGQSTKWTFYGPKDYEFGDKTVLKGIRKNAKKIGNCTYEQLQFEGLRSVMNRGGEGYIMISTITKHNKREYSKGLLTSSGWTQPFTLSE